MKKQTQQQIDFKKVVNNLNKRIEKMTEKKKEIYTDFTADAFDITSVNDCCKAIDDLMFEEESDNGL
jgi:uncharacterized protein (UPF0335 family)